mgnify:CR=1 FL=1|jgi:hypothetical protein
MTLEYDKAYSEATGQVSSQQIDDHYVFIKNREKK